MEMHILLFISVLLLIIIKHFVHGSSSPSSSSKKIPPGPKGLPIIGSLHKLGSKPHHSLAALARTHGSIMTLKLGSITTLVASSSEAAREILQKQEQLFSDRYVLQVITAQPNPEATLAWVPGDAAWRNRRRICTTKMFAARRLDLLRHLRQRKAEELVRFFGKKSAAGAPVDMGRAAFATALNLISSTIFSIDMVDSAFETAQEFKDLVWRIMEDAGKPNLSDYFPVLKWLDVQGVKRHVRPSYVRLHETFEEVIVERLEDRKSGKIRKDDFLDALLDQCEEEGSGFNRQTIKPLILV